MTDIIDAHHHIWRRRDLPWLDGPMQPRIFGPYEAIRRDYLIDEYLADLAGTGVTKSVYVQCNWPKDRFEDEVAYVQQAAHETGFPQAIVGYADFLASDVRPQLDRLTKYPGMRGLRMQLQWHKNPQYQFALRPRSGARSDLAEERRASCRLRLVVRPAGVRRPDAGRRRARRQRAQGDLHPAARRHDRGSFARRLGPNGEKPCGSLPRARMSFRSFRRSAPSFTKTIRRISPPWCMKQSIFSGRSAACSARIFRSKNCGPSMPI